MGLDVEAKPDGQLARIWSNSRSWLRLPAPVSQARSQRAMPWRTIFAQAASIWIATRLAFAALTLYYPLIVGGRGTSQNTIVVYRVIRRWANWDGTAYLHIVLRGYWQPVETVYFPLYPGTVRVVAALIGSHWVTAELLVSNLSALLAFFGVAALAAQIAPMGRERQTARTAALLYAAYPLAFFLTAAYSDGLFAGLAAFTLLFGMRRRWGWAMVFGILAGLSRPVSPALILPLAWEALQRYRELRGMATKREALRQMWPAFGAVLGPLIGLGAYCVYLWASFGDPLIFVASESSWRHVFMLPIISIPVAIIQFLGIPLFTSFKLRVLLDLAPVLAAVILTFFAAKRAPVGLTLYMLCLLFLVTSEPLNFTDLFVSGGRYMLAAIPLFIVFAERLSRSEWVFPALLWSGALLQAILTIYYLQHGWLV